MGATTFIGGNNLATFPSTTTYQTTTITQPARAHNILIYAAIQLQNFASIPVVAECRVTNIGSVFSTTLPAAGTTPSYGQIVIVDRLVNARSDSYTLTCWRRLFGSTTARTEAPRRNVVILAIP